MLKACFSSPKLKALQSLLQCGLPATIGHLELLWNFASTHSPHGDIGRWSDIEIAGACEWPGEASRFVAALVQSRFLDADSDHRLIVHDWQEHCSRWVRALVAKSGRAFVCHTHAKQCARTCAKSATVRTVEPTVVATTEPTTERLPILSFPILSSPILSSPNIVRSEASRTTSDYSDDFETFWSAFPSGRRKSKGAAYKAWQKAVQSSEPEVIITRAEQYAASPEGRGEFVKMPSTWLNQRCWEDDDAAWNLGSGQQAKNQGLVERAMERYSDGE